MLGRCYTTNESNRQQEGARIATMNTTGLEFATFIVRKQLLSSLVTIALSSAVYSFQLQAKLYINHHICVQEYHDIACLLNRKVSSQVRFPVNMIMTSHQKSPLCLARCECCQAREQTSGCRRCGKEACEGSRQRQSCPTIGWVRPKLLIPFPAFLFAVPKPKVTDDGVRQGLQGLDSGLELFCHLSPCPFQHFRC